MKKIIALIISATMLLSLSACNKGKGTPASSNATTKAAAAGEGADGNTDATKKNTDAGAIVLLPGELYQFDKDADGGPNEWVEFYPDTAVTEGIYVYVYKHADDAKVYTDMGFTEEDTKVLATCTLTKPEEADYQWGSLYVNPDNAQPGVYDIVFVKDGKAVAVMKANFFKEGDLDGKSDDDLRGMMKDF